MIGEVRAPAVLRCLVTLFLPLPPRREKLRFDRNSDSEQCVGISPRAEQEPNPAPYVLLLFIKRGRRGNKCPSEQKLCPGFAKRCVKKRTAPRDAASPLRMRSSVTTSSCHDAD